MSMNKFVHFSRARLSNELTRSTINIFDWNGQLDENLKEDEKQFNISMTKTEEKDMGFIKYTIEGRRANVKAFLDWYDLEVDPENEGAIL